MLAGTALKRAVNEIHNPLEKVSIQVLGEAVPSTDRLKEEEEERWREGQRRRGGRMRAKRRKGPREGRRRGGRGGKEEGW